MRLCVVWDSNSGHQLLLPPANYCPIFASWTTHGQAVPKGPGFGTDFTLACPYTLLAHYYERDWAEEYGVAPELVRVWVRHARCRRPPPCMPPTTPTRHPPTHAHTRAHGRSPPLSDGRWRRHRLDWSRRRSCLRSSARRWKQQPLHRSGRWGRRGRRPHASNWGPTATAEKVVVQTRMESPFFNSIALIHPVCDGPPAAPVTQCPCAGARDSSEGRPKQLSNTAQRVLSNCP